MGVGKKKTRASRLRLGVTRRLDMSPSNARARERLEIDGDDERVNPFIIDRARVSDDEAQRQTSTTVVVAVLLVDDPRYTDQSKRELNLDQIRLLAREWHIPAASLIGELETA